MLCICIKKFKLALKIKREDEIEKYNFLSIDQMLRGS